MARQRRKFSAEFKREAVQLTHDPERTVAEVGEDLGIDASVLKRWRAEARADGQQASPGSGRRKAPDEEVARLKRELVRVQQERDILKKALAYFARERG